VTRPIRIVVTGVGAIIGQGIVRSLRRSRRAVHIVGVDRSEASPGPRMCDDFRKKPACDESQPEYLDFWRRMLREDAIDLVLPGLENDVHYLDGARDPLAETGARIALNRHELIALTADKWVFAEALSAGGFTRIPTRIDGDWDEAVHDLGPPPLLLKPRRGNGSRGIVRLRDAEDFAYWSRRAGVDFMLQRIVGTDDEEYTVGAFGLGDGNTLPPILFRRRLSPAGNTQSVEVVRDPDLAEATRALCAHFRPVGATNLQFRKEGRRCFLLEINPRISSSTSLRAAFGYNEAAMSIDFHLRDQVPATPRIRGGRGWRYSEDFVVHDRAPR
jgi:carbamoyl-phosphate synthase large subunit